MLLAGKFEGILDLVLLAFRLVRLAANGGAAGGVILGIIGVVGIGLLLYYFGHQEEA